MKKLTLLIAAFALSFQAMAEGFQINNLSARQSGMAHVGTGMILGAESTWFNPGALVMQKSILDVSAGFSGIVSKVKFADDSYNASTDNPMSLPFYAYASVRPMKWFALGLAFNTPHTSSINWGNDWEGASLCQNASINQYNLQPTLALRVGEQVAIGAGLMIAWGDFSFSHSMLPVGGFTNSEFSDLLDNVGLAVNGGSLASLKVSGSAKTAYGFNAGIFWTPNKTFSVGVSYRHRLKMKVEDGSAALLFADNEATQKYVPELLAQAMGLDSELLSQSTISTELVTPGVISAGFNVSLLNILDIAADVQYNLWSAYDQMSIYLNTPNGQIELTETTTADKSYRNTFTGRLGVQVSPVGWLAARVGVACDQSPVRDGHLSPEMPSMSTFGITAGLSFRFIKLLHLDLSYGYSAPFDGSRAGFAEYVHIFTDELKQFGGTYSSEAHTFSVGLRVSF